MQVDVVGSSLDVKGVAEIEAGAGDEEAFQLGEKLQEAQA